MTNYVFCSNSRNMFQVYAAVESLNKLNLNNCLTALLYDSTVTQRDIDNLPSNVLCIKIPESINCHPAYYRLFIPKLTKKLLSNCIYCDTDVIFKNADSFSYKNKHMISAYGNGFTHFCTSIMFMNLDLIRKHKIDDIWIAEIEKNHATFDEHIINEFTPKERINMIDPEFHCFNPPNWDFMGIHHFRYSKPWYSPPPEDKESEEWINIIKGNKYYYDKFLDNVKNKIMADPVKIIDNLIMQELLEKEDYHFIAQVQTFVSIAFDENLDSRLFVDFLQRLYEIDSNFTTRLSMGNLSNFRFQTGETAEELLNKFLKEIAW